MKNYLLLALTQGPDGPVVTQQGRIEEQLDAGNFLVRLYTPALRYNVASVADLRSFCLFENVEQLTGYLSVVIPQQKPPVSVAALVETEIPADFDA